MLPGRTGLIELRLAYNRNTQRTVCNASRSPVFRGPGAMGAVAPGPAVFRGPQFWEVYFLLCAICEIYYAATEVYLLFCLLCCYC